jgi:hypothetical protein
MDRINVDDLKLRPEVASPPLWSAGPGCATINDGHARDRQGGGQSTTSTSTTSKALSLIISGRAREAFDLSSESDATRDRVRPQHLRPKLPAWPAGWSRRAPAWSRSSGRRSPTATTTRGMSQRILTKRMKTSGPMLDTGAVGADQRHGRAGPAGGNAGGGGRRIRPQPAAGRQHLRQRQQRRRPRPLALLLHRHAWPARASSGERVRQVGRPPRPRSKTRSIPTNCWRRSTTRSASTRTIVYNHLNQPRELVKADRSGRSGGKGRRSGCSSCLVRRGPPAPRSA